eukprot:CAMPEP_0179319174 /NCGR_PEP_ID=MMETSP0797-20121207/57330_1 /TAXON_ID=47934 /ORGANISM="Dinophysis acuminata, Strain DAEP01" /LENGTH=56 /DNA_ID=CAMNT_0021030499 /DNA_START=93 /DNA_END=260 /DNA_ORIENTATION=+
MPLRVEAALAIFNGSAPMYSQRTGSVNCRFGLVASSGSSTVDLTACSRVISQEKVA